MSFVRKIEVECDHDGCIKTAIYFHRLTIGSSNSEVVYFKACWDHLGNFSAQFRSAASVVVWDNLTRDEYLVHQVMNT